MSYPSYNNSFPIKPRESFHTSVGILKKKNTINKKSKWPYILFILIILIAIGIGIYLIENNKKKKEKNKFLI